MSANFMKKKRLAKAGKHAALVHGWDKSEKKQPPVIISTASTDSMKMKAICDLSHAVERLSAALTSVSTQVEISHCHFDATGKMPSVSVNQSHDNLD